MGQEPCYWNCDGYEELNPLTLEYLKTKERTEEHTAFLLIFTIVERLYQQKEKKILHSIRFNRLTSKND